MSLNKFIFNSLIVLVDLSFAFREYYAKSDYREGPLSLLRIVHNTHKKKTRLEGKILNPKGSPK